MENLVKRIIFDSLEESVYVTAKITRGEDFTDGKPSREVIMKTVNSVVSKGHLACTEHFTVFIGRMDFTGSFGCNVNSPLVRQNPWFDVTHDGLYVMCNPRFLIEYFMANDKDTYSEAFTKVCTLYPVPDGYSSEGRKTFFIESNIGCTREMNRHRGLSPLELSTRYLTMTDKDMNFTDSIVEQEYKRAGALHLYAELLGNNEPRDLARDILPLGTRTKCFYTGFDKSWNHYFGLRRNPKTAHPMILDLANKIYGV